MIQLVTDERGWQIAKQFPGSGRRVHGYNALVGGRIRGTKGYGRSSYVRGSVRPDARELHHLGPFLNVFSNELAKLSGGTRKRRVAKVCNPRSHRGIGENSIDLLVEFLDDIGGRIFWRADTQPRARIIARQKIVQ